MIVMIIFYLIVAISSILYEPKNAPAWVVGSLFYIFLIIVYKLKKPKNENK
jgi:L-asparagine transporter-like permease